MTNAFAEARRLRWQRSIRYRDDDDDTVEAAFYEISPDPRTGKPRRFGRGFKLARRPKTVGVGKGLGRG